MVSSLTHKMGMLAVFALSFLVTWGCTEDVTPVWTVVLSITGGQFDENDQITLPADGSSRVTVTVQVHDQDGNAPGGGLVWVRAVENTLRQPACILDNLICHYDSQGRNFTLTQGAATTLVMCLTEDEQGEDVPLLGTVTILAGYVGSTASDSATIVCQ